MRIRKLMLVFLSWLTAAVTLVAGMPHFVCHCPDGRVKPICFPFSSDANSCCCQGPCCPKEQNNCPCSLPTSATKEESGKLCCRAGAVKSPGAGDEVRDRGCIKVLVKPEIAAPIVSKLAEVKDVPLELTLAPEAGIFRLSPVAEKRLWQNHTISPPTDLVITLQHLLI